MLITILILAITAADAYAPLRLYNGAWQMVKSGETAPEALIDTCQLVGRYYTYQSRISPKMRAFNARRRNGCL